MIAIGIAFIKLPQIAGDDSISSKSVFKKPQVWLGALGIFCYVGAEVGSASQIAPYLKESGFATDVAVKLSAIILGWRDGRPVFRVNIAQHTVKYQKIISIRFM